MIPLRRLDFMAAVDGVHRWTGALVGLLLVVIGLSGLALVHKDAWLRATLPHAADARVADVRVIGAATSVIFADPRATSVTFASKGLGVHRVTFGDVAHGAYVDQGGRTVTRWDTKWARLEVWLFDLHHYLLVGDVGKTTTGIAGLAGLGFVITGLVLWWPTRRSFEGRLWPRAWNRFGILRHHRDLGVLVAPLLIATFATGVLMTLKPVEIAAMSLFSSRAALESATRTPTHEGGAWNANRTDWTKLFQTAEGRFPGSELRVVTAPSKPGGLIVVRVRQPGEPTPNGRTFLWFDPADQALVGVRDALAAPRGARLSAWEYPVHSGKTGGWLWTALVTLSGIALVTLGGFGLYTFWLNRLRRRRPVNRRLTSGA